MALHNMDIYQKGRKLSGIAFKELLRVLDRCEYRITSLQTAREIKKVECLRHHFKVPDRDLRDKHDKGIVALLSGMIKQTTPYKAEIPAIIYSPSTKGHSVLSTPEEYMNKMAFESLLD